MKKITKVLVITSCLTLTFSNIVFANSDNKSSNYVNISNEKSDEKSFTISGYEFTYKNAPEEVKKGYEKSCEEFNIEPSPENLIFVPDDGINMYNLDMYKEARVWFDVAYSKKGGYFTVEGGSKKYTVSTDVTVGYGHITSGNPVHLTQILCKNLAGVNIEPDSQFGSNTYNAVKTLQGKLGLTKDGIVGKQTWEAAGNRIP